MTRQVRLTVQTKEGGGTKEIGTAIVDALPNGDSMVDLNISDPEMIKILGGAKIKGIIQGMKFDNDIR